MSKVGLTCRWLAVIPFSVIVFNNSTMAAGCGPGVDWVKDCPPGTDQSPSKAEVQLEIPCGGVRTPIVELRGPTRVERQGGTSVSPYTIDTEMVQLKLSGQVPGVGKVTIRGGRDAAPEQERIFGEITQTAGNTLAHSYFDVYVAVDTPMGTLYSKEACRMSSDIDRVPPWYPANPNNVYLCENGNTTLELYSWVDLNGNNIIDPGELVGPPVACLIKDITKHLAVTLNSFSATRLGSSDVVRLNWATATETKNLGFNIYRATKDQKGNFVNPIKINGNPIPTQASDSNSGASYIFTDANAPSGNTLYYAIVDISEDGDENIADIVPVR